jgi:hypothetical protein
MSEQNSHEMESIVNCPYCNKPVPMVMKSYQAASELIDFLESKMGIGKTCQFQGVGRCECGAAVVASLYVTGVGK